MNHLLCHRVKPRSCALISFFLQGQVMTPHFFFKKIRVKTDNILCFKQRGDYQYDQLI